MLCHGPLPGSSSVPAGFGVHVYGSEHAVIHPDIPTVPNVGFLIDGDIFHPGDSYTVPEDPAGTLLLPGSGPWHSTAEMIDYARAVGPRRGFIIHDALLSEIGLSVLEMFAGLAAAHSSTVVPGANRVNCAPFGPAARPANISSTPSPISLSSASWMMNPRRGPTARA